MIWGCGVTGNMLDYKSFAPGSSPGVLVGDMMKKVTLRTVEECSKLENRYMGNVWCPYIPITEYCSGEEHVWPTPAYQSDNGKLFLTEEEAIEEDKKADMA